VIPFLTVTGVAAPLAVANVDTDRILPGRFLKTTGKAGLGKGLFFALREDPHFILNREPWTHASILVALENFGCGSSREHAPWALLDFGIRCVIAPSFADIFYGNCLRNGLLPIRLPRRVVDGLITLSSNSAQAIFHIDLPSQRITADAELRIEFEIDSAAKETLMNGEDDIARTERCLPLIDRFERERREAQSWRNDIPLARF
jgi:3-isopropylmalate/(R)-2-methylmalate dehydratase small subunit